MIKAIIRFAADSIAEIMMLEIVYSVAVKGDCVPSIPSSYVAMSLAPTSRTFAAEFHLNWVLYTSCRS